MSGNGLFITFEGVEGSGKSTQASILQTFLEAKGHRVVRTREPGGFKVPISERIREILLDVAHKEMAPLTELFLYLASRAQHVESLVKPSLDDDCIVISDRFFDASIAYQGAGRKLDKDMIMELSLTATKGIKPDITFLVDVPAEVGLKRLGPTPECKDRIEREKIEFHDRVRMGYLEVADREAERFRIIDGQKSVSSISSEIAGYIEPLLGALPRKDS